LQIYIEERLILVLYKKSTTELYSNEDFNQKEYLMYAIEPGNNNSVEKSTNSLLLTVESYYFDIKNYN